jgi:hypothetical protein
VTLFGWATHTTTERPRPTKNVGPIWRDLVCVPGRSWGVWNAT